MQRKITKLFRIFELYKRLKGSLNQSHVFLKPYNKTKSNYDNCTFGDGQFPPTKCGRCWPLFLYSSFVSRSGNAVRQRALVGWKSSASLDLVCGARSSCSGGWENPAWRFCVLMLCNKFPNIRN